MHIDPASAWAVFSTVVTLAAACAAALPKPTHKGVSLFLRQVLDAAAFNFGNARNAEAPSASANLMPDGTIKSLFAAFLAAGLALMLLSPGHAFAKPAPRPTHAPIRQSAGLSALAAEITADMLADVNAAKTLADAQKDTTASACWAELSTELTAQQAAQNAANLPKIHLAFTFQRARGIVQATSASSALSIACAPLAAQVKMDVLGLVNIVVSGTFSAAKIAPLFGL